MKRHRDYPIRNEYAHFFLQLWGIDNSISGASDVLESIKNILVNLLEVDGLLLFVAKTYSIV